MTDAGWRREIREAFARHGRTLDDDVLEELAQHAAASYAAARAESLSGDAARARVLDEIAAWTRDGRAFRPRPGRRPDPPHPPAGSSRLTGLIQDVRYAERQVGFSPARHRAADVDPRRVARWSNRILDGRRYWRRSGGA